jgi:putative ABC transport system permease protein
MYLRLAIKNMRARKTRTALTCSGIVIGIALLTLLTALGAGVQKTAYRNLTEKSPLTKLTVQPKAAAPNLTNLLPGQAKTGITQTTLNDISKIPHVTKVYPEIMFRHLSSLRINWLGLGLQTDAMIFGVPYDYIADDYSGTKESWDNPSPPYPALISKKIIDIYNFTVAPASGLPAFSEKDLGGIAVAVLPDVSTFFPSLSAPKNPLPTKLIGFSDKTSIVGITLPMKVVRDLNAASNPSAPETYSSLHLEIDKAENLETVRSRVAALGYDAVSPLDEIKGISENITLITYGLTALSLIVLLVAALMIANTFLSAAQERKREIGIFRALGATKQDVKKIFLAEALVIGTLGSGIGIAIAATGGLILNTYAAKTLATLTINPTQLFLFEPLSLLLIFFAGIAVSLVSAYFPAAKAAKLNPLDALSN